jgi:hypothetical protein
MYYLNHLTILDRITNLPHVIKVILANSHVLLNQIHNYKMNRVSYGMEYYSLVTHILVACPTKFRDGKQKDCGEGELVG